MRATLSFKLPEEQEEFEAVQNTFIFISAIVAVKNKLRSKLKHESLSSETIRHLEEIQQELFTNLDGVEV